MGKTRIILDTNVIISAFGWTGKPWIILERVLEGEFELIVSKKQFVEIRRVSEYPKFSFSEEQKRRMLDIIGRIATVVETHGDVNIIKDDPSDNMFLEAAIEFDVPFIITGDPHLLNLKEYQNVKIMNPAQFLRD